MRQEVPFGELRSKMQRPQPGHVSWRRELWALLRRADTIQPDLYQAQWVPYLAGHTDVWANCPLPCEDIRQLEDDVRRAPFAHFAVTLLVAWDARRGRGAGDDTNLFLSHEHRDRVIDLTIAGPLNYGDAMGALLGADALTHIQALAAPRGGLGIEEARALAGSATAANLRTLVLDENPLRTQGTRALLTSRHLSGLRKLRLRRCEVGVRALRALGTSPRAPRLERLDLGENDLGPKGAKALATATTFEALTSLDVRENQLGDAGVRALASAPGMSGVRTCSLAHNRVSDNGVLELAQGGALASMKHLNLSHNQLTTRGALYLLEATAHALVSLNLTGNPIGSLDDVREAARERGVRCHVS